jgi:hypothetical protein
VVQANVDIERDKVANDLLLTGCVESAAYVHRPAISPSIEAAGRRMRTDGHIAVLFFNSCEAPRFAQPETPELRQPGKFTRVVRRITLSTRNHFLRDNIFWKCGEGGVLGFRYLRKWHRHSVAAAERRKLESN